MLKDRDYSLEEFQQHLKNSLRVRSSLDLQTALGTALKKLDAREVNLIIESKLNSSSDWGLGLEELLFFWTVFYKSIKYNAASLPIVDTVLKTIETELAKRGLTNKEDFRLDYQDIWLSSKAKEVLKREIREDLHVGLNVAEISLAKIEENIGLRGYFNRITSIAAQRLNQEETHEDWDFIGNYLFYFIHGTIEKFPELGETNFADIFVESVLGKDRTETLVMLLNSKQIEVGSILASECIVVDMIEATGELGGRVSNPFDDNQVIEATREGLKALSKVWETLTPVPIRELIALISHH